MPSPLFPLLSLASLIACDHQYLAIRNAEVVEGTPQYAYEDLWVGTTTPTYAVTSGSLDMTIHSSTTVAVSVAGDFAFPVTEIVFLGLANEYSEVGDHLVYILTNEERAAQRAEITIEVLAEKPTQEWCTPKRLGTWTCFIRVDEGLGGLGLAAAGGVSLSMYTELPSPLDALDGADEGGGGICEGYTVEDCCGGSGGVQAVECAWDPACDCPAGTTDVGTTGDGYRRCDCPG